MSEQRPPNRTDEIAAKRELVRGYIMGNPTYTMEAVALLCDVSLAVVMQAVDPLPPKPRMVRRGD